MAKPFALQPIHELMQTRTDEATQHLARLIASERDARNKLDMLTQFRDEYVDRFRQATQNGITQREWQNYLEFLNRLDDAINAQRQAVAVQERNTAAGKEHWQQQRRKLKAFDTLANRHLTKENAAELKREQKMLDEFAARNSGPGKEDQ
ncbi:flagellar export protein FliJ [Propionivibrio limicola]|uniref:flagellar export protein FliJ n=1 Tax=Propionivibrio limicola TaxID=167645 RepID=UPI001290B205|nr:flagellar export protein FliJ [Propionivibrio limicola]